MGLFLSGAIYVILNTLVSSDNLFQDFRVVLWWPLVYFLFYFIAFNDVQDKYVRFIIKLIPILFIVLLVQYLSIRSMTIFRYTESGKLMYAASNTILFQCIVNAVCFFTKKKAFKIPLSFHGIDFGSIVI